MNKTLRLGQINFINCLPVNLAIAQAITERKTNLDFNIETVSTYPSEVNELLRLGAIDLAPISSFEYLSNTDKYQILDGISISSKIQADSVLVFADSYESIVNAKEVFVTNKSASSVNLLKIILRKKFSKDLNQIKFIRFKDNSKNYPIKLLIGDEALKESLEQNYNYVLDLGTAWYELTSLPMVFAVWAFNKKSPLIDHYEEINQFILQAQSQGFNQLYDKVLQTAKLATNLPQSKLVEYFEHLDYDFGTQHRESLRLFDLQLKYTKGCSSEYR